MTGGNNSFFGAYAGQMMTTGAENSFFGAGAGQSNTTASLNAFFGINAGLNTTIGCCNSFFGNDAGIGNTTGAGNTFFGGTTGGANTTGNLNAFFGDFTGYNLASGSGNTFVGAYTAQAVTAGSYNLVLGNNISIANNLTYAAAIGARSSVTQSNSIVLGAINGINGATADTNFGIGTTAPTTRFQIKTATRNYGFTHTDGAISIGSYVGSSTSGALGGWLGTQSNHKLFFFTNNGQPTMTVDTTGNVGVGTTAPTSKLEIAAQNGLAITGFQPFMTFRDTNDANKRSVLQSARGGFSFYPNNFIGGNPAMVLDNSGNAGIGTGTPIHRLTLAGGPSWTSNAWVGSMALDNASAIGWAANASGQSVRIGHSTGGLYFFRTNSALGTTTSPANYDMEITDTGNVTQPINNNGLVKAMIHADRNGGIISCYNGITNTSAGNCGFTITKPAGPGIYRIDFGFPVSARFVSITPEYATTCNINPIQCRNAGANFRFFDVRLEVFTFDADNSADTADAAFMVVIY